MNVMKNRRALLATFLLCALVAVTAVVYGAQNSLAFGAGAGARGAQDTANLERRISLLEQRFYSIENSINRLEQQAAFQSRTTMPPQSSVRDSDINLLRAEIEVLKGRVGELECGIVKLDERTTASDKRESRRRSAAADPCRLNAETPVRLSARP